MRQTYRRAGIVEWYRNDGGRRGDPTYSSVARHYAAALGKDNETTGRTETCLYAAGHWLAVRASRSVTFCATDSRNRGTPRGRQLLPVTSDSAMRSNLNRLKELGSQHRTHKTD